MAQARKTPPERPDPQGGPDLYESDYAAWLYHNAALIRAGRFAEVDIENVAEELEDLGRSEQRALASQIAVILLHLLKWQLQPEQRSGSWRGFVHKRRRSAQDLLAESPSLRPRVPELVADRYGIARCNAAIETGLPDSAFPVDCPYGVDQILDDAFWPGDAG
jgi:hypothetical protein